MHQQAELAELSCQDRKPLRPVADSCSEQSCQRTLSSSSFSAGPRKSKSTEIGGSECCAPSTDRKHRALHSLSCGVAGTWLALYICQSRFGFASLHNVNHPVKKRDDMPSFFVAVPSR